MIENGVGDGVGISVVCNLKALGYLVWGFFIFFGGRGFGGSMVK